MISLFIAYLVLPIQCNFIDIKYPNLDPYNLRFPLGTNKIGGWSQSRQDIEVVKLLKNMTGGFFLEAGGFDGEMHSNTLFLEKNLGWNGLLIEANPHFCENILKLNRKCFLFCGGIHDNFIYILFSEFL